MSYCKFYSGLTENQLNRSAGPNRQRTNFFWPSDDQAKTTSKPSEKTRSFQTKQKYNEIKDVNPPKELFKKQLSSKIQFYDEIDAKKTPPTLRKQKRDSTQKFYEKRNNFHVNDAPTKSKQKTIESKIEFYDFVEDKKSNPPVTKVNPAKNVQEKKRISFNNHDDWDMTKKGILKNHDRGVRVEHNVPIDLSERHTVNRNYGSKLQLSKSVDNIAKMKTEISDVYEENNAKINGMVNQLKKLNVNKEKVDKSRRIETGMQDSFEYRKKPQNDFHNDHVPPARKNEEHSRTYTQRRSNHENGWNNDNYEDFQESRSLKNFDDDSYTRRHSNQYDRSNLRKHVQTTKNTFIVRLPVDTIDEIDEYQYEIVKKIPAVSDYNNRNQRSVSIKRSATINGSNDYPNEARRRAHTHLQSNIFFQDDERLQQHQRPLSIRESAVTRVGVGLPNL